MTFTDKNVRKPEDLDKLDKDGLIAFLRSGRKGKVGLWNAWRSKVRGLGNLVGDHLREVHLEWVYLMEAHLEGANLVWAHLGWEGIPNIISISLHFSCRAINRGVSNIMD